VWFLSVEGSKEEKKRSKENGESGKSKGKEEEGENCRNPF